MDGINASQNSTGTGNVPNNNYEVYHAEVSDTIMIKDKESDVTIWYEGKQNKDAQVSIWQDKENGVLNVHAKGLKGARINNYSITQALPTVYTLDDCQNTSVMANDVKGGDTIIINGGQGNTVRIDEGDNVIDGGSLVTHSDLWKVLEKTGGRSLEYHQSNTKKK